jgi:hypothetical protein
MYKAGAGAHGRRVGIYKQPIRVRLGPMRAEPFRLVLVTVSLVLPLFADGPAPVPTPPKAAPVQGATAAAAAPTPTPTPVPTMPANLRLTNGTVLHNVAVVRWMKESVTVRHTGGADTIYYSYIAEPDHTTVLAARDDAMKNQKSESSSKVPENAIKGTISVATDDGVEMPLSGVKVFAVTTEALGLFSTDGRNVRLPKPLASAVTDAAGQFSMLVPKGEDFFIFAKAAKFLGQGWGYYEWRVTSSQIGDRQNLVLTGATIVPLAEQKTVTFDTK